MSATLFSFLPDRAVGRVVKNHALPGLEYEVVEATPDRVLLRRLPAKGPEEIEIELKTSAFWTEVE